LQKLNAFVSVETTLIDTSNSSSRISTGLLASEMKIVAVTGSEICVEQQQT
jgi:hypothetical protein